MHHHTWSLVNHILLKDNATLLVFLLTNLISHGQYCLLVLFESITPKLSWAVNGDMEHTLQRRKEKEIMEKITNQLL